VEPELRAALRVTELAGPHYKVVLAVATVLAVVVVTSVGAALAILMELAVVLVVALGSLEELVRPPRLAVAHLRLSLVTLAIPAVAWGMATPPDLLGMD
jgi:hypothetical protein